MLFQTESTGGFEGKLEISNGVYVAGHLSDIGGRSVTRRTKVNVKQQQPPYETK